MHNAIVTIYSQVVHEPSGIRRFWFGVSLLSPLRPILRNGNPLLKFLGNAFTGERIGTTAHKLSEACVGLTRSRAGVKKLVEQVITHLLNE